MRNRIPSTTSNTATGIQISWVIGPWKTPASCNGRATTSTAEPRKPTHASQTGMLRARRKRYAKIVLPMAKQVAPTSVLALSCRLGEGVLGAVAAVRMMGLLSVAKASVGAAPPDAAAAQALGAMLLQQDNASTLVGATCFAIGSTIFAYLFLRARSIPAWLAWVGFLGSAVLVVVLPMQLAGVFRGPGTQLIWIPVAVFEVVLGIWFLIRGAAAPVRRSS